MEDRLAVEEVCTDMDDFYINSALEIFPRARIVLDHYHIVAWGIHQMNTLRNILESVSGKRFQVKHLLMKPIQHLTEEEFKKLEPCFAAFPEVKVAWKIVHELRRIYYQRNWRKAHSQLRRTVWLCEQSGIPEMKDLAKTLRRRKMEILNHYISRTSNAKTEALHARFETMKRLHCGIRNVERFAKRLMFCLLPLSTLSHLFTQSV